MHLLSELPAWAWAIALLLEQLIYIRLIDKLKLKAMKEIAAMRAKIALDIAINARMIQLSKKAGWTRVSKNTFTTGDP